MKGPKLWLVLCALTIAVNLDAGCAHGSDGVRQACSNANDGLAIGYRTFTAWYRVEQQQIRAAIPSSPAAAQRRLDLIEPIAVKVLEVLDKSRYAAEAACTENVFAAVDAGTKDRAALLSALATVAADVAAATAKIANWRPL